MRNFFLICFLVFSFQLAVAKPIMRFFEVKKDTNYIESYYNDLIIRLYSGEKTHSLELTDLNNSYHLKYLPNGYFNLGVGVNYRWFGISLATKVPVFLNSEIKHGETKRFGIQTYAYTNKFSADILTSFSSGYYLKDSYLQLSNYTKNKEYQRPDISSANIGINVNYIFNHERFSYKAAFRNTEKQKKSAGSLLAGGGLFSYQTTADSAIVPREIDADYFSKTRNLTKSGVLALNANLGYAYSLVFLKNGIFTLSYILGSGLQDNSYGSQTAQEINRWRFSMNHTGSLGFGYWFNRYYLRLVVIKSAQYSSLKYNDLLIGNGTNFMQISLGKRFSVKK
ncbi:MAG: DUF4421 family protein [Prolixibacteraceae bacterium]